MIEEPYRWVEAIANRREYIETQLATGAPIAAVSFEAGIVLASVGASRQKLFEIYDRIALGALGHPGDIERLRMAAIDIASTEGFTRSAADVSLRRLAHYSLSPVLKAAFEQVYGPPYLARLLFAELGKTAGEDVFLALDFDGTIDVQAARNFAVISGTADSRRAIEAHLEEHSGGIVDVAAALHLLSDALSGGPSGDNPTDVQAAMLDRNAGHAITYRPIGDAEVRAMLTKSPR